MKLPESVEAYYTSLWASANLDTQPNLIDIVSRANT